MAQIVLTTTQRQSHRSSHVNVAEAGRLVAALAISVVAVMVASSWVTHAIAWTMLSISLAVVFTALVTAAIATLLDRP